MWNAPACEADDVIENVPVSDPEAILAQTSNVPGLPKALFPILVQPDATVIVLLAFHCPTNSRSSPALTVVGHVIVCDVVPELETDDVVSS